MNIQQAPLTFKQAYIPQKMNASQIPTSPDMSLAGSGMSGAQQLALNNQVQVISQIAQWNPATGMEGWVTTLYQNILDRTPSQEELKPQLEFVKANGTAGVYKQFFTSKEFQEKQLPPNIVIDKLYRSILFREPEPQGKQSWLQTMGQGLPVDRVIDGFLAGREYQENIAKGKAPVFTLDA